MEASLLESTPVATQEAVTPLSVSSYETTPCSTWKATPCSQASTRPASASVWGAYGEAHFLSIGHVCAAVVYFGIRMNMAGMLTSEEGPSNLCNRSTLTFSQCPGYLLCMTASQVAAWGGTTDVAPELLGLTCRVYPDPSVWLILTLMVLPTHTASLVENAHCLCRGSRDCGRAAPEIHALHCIKCLRWTLHRSSKTSVL